jgi:hypothetical protein
MINCHDTINGAITISIIDDTPPDMLKLPLPTPFIDDSSPRSPLEFQKTASLAPKSAETFAAKVPLPTPFSDDSSPRSPLEFQKTASLVPKSAEMFAAAAATNACADVVQDASSNDQTQTQPRKRVVSFGKTVHYKEIRHIRDFSKEEVAAIWMTMPDYQIIKAMVKSTIIMMMKGEQISEEDIDFCTRGLEFRTKLGSRVRQNNKLRARFAVLNEQDLERDEGFCDPQYIAMACLEVSLECRQGARARALYDEKVIQSYLSDVRHGMSGTECFFDVSLQSSPVPTCSNNPEQVSSVCPTDLT